ncbi:hemicentin-2-like isoform X4 [Atheta coriaria]|uniref:hemicentin-2-like isoform X4 n=1 Tax=Dalotia coriaria TaxID=877792 RepID=UPI0031F36565
MSEQTFNKMKINAARNKSCLNRSSGNCSYKNARQDFSASSVQMLKMFMLVLVFCASCAHGKIEDEPASAVFEVEAVQGNVAKMPCDITPSLPGDKMHIAIWFKEGTGRKTPIYSYDARDKPLEQGKHWSDEQVLGGRGFFRYQDHPAKLTLDSVKDSDSGVYNCRVDFKQTPTRIVKVNLTVIIPPETIKIVEHGEQNVKNYILGPYNEGASINITCVAIGGRPPPKVTWWQENALLDDSFEYLSERRVRNVLHIDKLQRKHLHTVLTCQASNNNLVAPKSSSISLDLNLRPLWVKLIGDNRPLSAGHTYELSCEVVGARPTPTITWWKGSVEMKDTRIMTSPDSNTTTSVLTFVPSVDDGGKYLSCRGQLQEIPDSGIEDGWKLDIHHVPLVTLELGSNLNGSVIREGADVYFECNIKSNPWVYKVSWRHNGKTLFSNAQAGTIVSNQSLVLQSVTRARAGTYTCIGSNQEGDGESNTVDLNVKYAPVCRPGQQKVYGAARQEIVRITCELEANPTDVQFIWKFNNSAETIDIPASHVATEKTRSTAAYTPMTELDYGTLLCWGKNEIGVQKDPCVFYINPAGKPDALSNCTILNQTVESLHVECIEGFDGGLQQEFVMEVYDTQSGKLVSNVTSRTPYFSVAGLESGSGFDIQVYAGNVKGRSRVTRLHAFTAKSAEKHTGFFAAYTPVFLHITPILGALIGIVGALILVAIIIVIVIRMRGGGDRDDKDYDDGGLSSAGRRCVAGGGDKASTEPLNKDLNDSVDSLEEKNPDIIPQSNGEDDYQADERAFQRLNNSSMRVYSRMQSPNPKMKNGPYDYSKTKDEITYAELSLPNQQMPHVIYNQQAIPMSVIRRQEPTLYAQIDIGKRMPPCMQPLSPPHPSTFQGMQHLPTYMPRAIRDDTHIHDGGMSAETPLIHPRDTSSLQPLLESTRNTPMITSTLPRVVTATRF